MYSSMRIGPSFNGIMNGNYISTEGRKYEILLTTGNALDNSAKQIAQEVSPVASVVLENFSANKAVATLIDLMNIRVRSSHKTLPEAVEISEFIQDPLGFYLRGTGKAKAKFTIGYSYTSKPMELD
jgi:hypothetical protein